MKTIKLAAPAKINLTLEVLDKRPDGYHNIKSIMQAISLYDFLTIKVRDADKNLICLDGSSDKIPYDEKNLVYKAADKFLSKAKLNNKKIDIYIEKNIPVEAGLAGGSTDAAATFFGLNLIFDNVLFKKDIEELCASLGSDLNFCLHGGTAVCSSRGEIIKKIPDLKSFVTLIKPLGYGISAKEAYSKFANKNITHEVCYTDMMVKNFNKKFLYNSLEQAVLSDYPELEEIKSKLPDSLMSGSGPTYFILQRYCPVDFNRDKFCIIEDLKFVPDGVKILTNVNN